MIQSLRQLMTCRWSARRLQRYLDADPAAPLTAAEVARLEAHLNVCEKCTQATAEYRALHQALSRWGAAHADSAAVTRLRAYVRTLDQGRR